MFWIGSRFCKIFYNFQFKHQSWGNSFGLEGDVMPTQKLWLKQVLLTWMVRDEILAKCITAEVGSFTVPSTLFLQNYSWHPVHNAFCQRAMELVLKAFCFMSLIFFFAIFSNFCVSMNRGSRGEMVQPWGPYPVIDFYATLSSTSMGVPHEDQCQDMGLYI